MTRLKIGIIGAVLAAGAVAWCIAQRQAQSHLQNEVQVLRLENQRMDSLLADNARLSNLVAQTQTANSLTRDQVSELLRLRGEVARLRQQVGELKKLQAEDRRLEGGAAAKPNSDAMDSKVEELNIRLPKTSWAPAGYATPEAALQTMMWARREGDTNSLLASLTPGFVEKAQKAWGDKFEDELTSELPGKINRVSECTIMKKEAISDSEVRLWYRVVEQDELRNIASSINITAKRVGDQWKLEP